MARSAVPICGLLLISLTGCPSASVTPEDIGMTGEDAASGRDARTGVDALAPDVAVMDGAEPIDAGVADLGIAPDPDSGVGDAGVVTTPITLPYNGNLMGPQILRFSAAVHSAILVRAVSGTASPGTLYVRSAAGALIESFSFFEDAVGDQRYVPVYLEAGGDYLVEVDAPPDADRSFLVAIEPITTILPFNLGTNQEATVNGTSGTLGFTFTATQGDVLRLSNARTCSQFNGRFYYQDLRFAENTAQQTVRRSGLQLVGLRKLEGANCPPDPDFGLRIWRATPITLGVNSAPASVSTSGFRPTPLSFTFQAPVGTIVTGKVSGTGYGYFFTTWFQDGSQDPTSDLFFGTFGPWVMTSSTPQVFDVEPESTMSGASNDVVMRAFVMPPPIAVSDPRTRQDVALEPGEQRVYSFAGNGAWAAGNTHFTVSFDVDGGQRASIYLSTAFPEGGGITSVPGAGRGSVMGTTLSIAIDPAATYYLRVFGDRASSGAMDPNLPETVHWSVTATP